jgi:hypothetical protein
MHDCAASACGLPDCDRKCTLDNSHAFELQHTDESRKLVKDNGTRVDPSYLASMSNETQQRAHSSVDWLLMALRMHLARACERWVVRFRGLNLPIYLFSPETALHETTSLHLAPTTHHTPWSGFSTPIRTLGTPIYGLGSIGGRIGPWGWVAKMGVLQ